MKIINKYNLLCPLFLSLILGVQTPLTGLAANKPSFLAPKTGVQVETFQPGRTELKTALKTVQYVLRFRQMRQLLDRDEEIDFGEAGGGEPSSIMAGCLLSQKTLMRCFYRKIRCLNR